MLTVDFYNETIIDFQPADESFRTESNVKEYQLKQYFYLHYFIEQPWKPKQTVI